MNPAIQKIDQLAKSLAEFKPLKEEYQQRLDKKIRLEFNYHSNSIEGNTLTYGETELLLIFDKTTGNHELREYEEMKSHDVAFELIKEWANDRERPLSEMGLKNLHQILLVRPFWKEALTPDRQPTRRLITVGNYKQQPNSVRLQNGEIFSYTSPDETPIEMGALIQWYRDEEEKKELHPVVLASLLHYKFVRIHPFDDGNGRISRLLMNYVLFRHHLPPVIIKSGDKKNYLFALNQADSGDIDAFVSYIIRQLAWTLDISIKAAKGNEIDESGDFDKKITLLKKRLGETPEIEVELRYTNQAVQRMIQNALVPLMHAWEKKLSAFDPLFLSRDVSFTAGDNLIASNAFNDIFWDKLNQYVRTDLVKLMRDNKIVIKSSLTGLRNIDNGVNINAGEINIHFFENAYEINWLSANGLSKLYHQGLTEKETDKISSDLGNWLHNIIDEYIDQNSNRKLL